MASAHHQVNYIELPAHNMDAMKRFYGQVFGWEFTDWGPEYVSFHAGIDGGFRGDGKVSSQPPGTLIVLFSSQLEETQQAITDAGGTIVVPIFEFPGGRRFEFTDPSGNQLAVWSTPTTNDEAS